MNELGISRGTTTTKSNITIDFVNTELMPLLLSMYPNAFYNCDKGSGNYERRCALWQMQLSRTPIDKQDVIKAIYRINLNTDSERLPTIAKVVEMAKIEKNLRLKSKGVSTRIIITPEQEFANEYHRILKKPNKSEKDWEMLENLKIYAAMFDGTKEADEIFEKYFGETREQFNNKW